MPEQVSRQPAAYRGARASNVGDRPLRYGDPDEVGLSPDRVRRLRGLAERWVADGATSALVLLVARRGVVVVHEAAGPLGPEPGAPPLPIDAVFPVASISKPVTAICAMCLVEDGLLGLNRPVQEYVPEFSGERKEAVMVHHLLTHTAGIDDSAINAHIRRLIESGEAGQPEGAGDSAYDLRFPWLRYFGLALAAPLARPPGREMAYSTLGICLLGEVIERVSQRRLGDFAAERVFGPLDMRDTTYGLPADTERVVRRRPNVKGTHTLTDPNAPPRRLAGTGLFTTAWDLALLGQMLLSGGRVPGSRERVLAPATVAAMTRNQVQGIPARYGDEYFPEATWGLGMDVHGQKRALRQGSLHSAAASSHGGAGGSNWWFDPTQQLVGVHLSVTAEYYPSLMEKWNADLFVNAAVAAVEEP